MKKADILTDILSQLHRANGPLLASQILINQYDISERTLRRYLTELIADNKIEKIGTKKSSRYMLINSVQDLKDSLSRPLFEREPVSYNSRFLKDYIPNETFYFSEDQLNLLFSEGSQGLENDPGGTYIRKIYNRLLIDLSYNSSRLEGNTYSLIETEKLVLEGIGNNNKLDEEKVMILNHKEAIRYLVDSASTLTPDTNTIRTLHFLLSDGLIPAGGSGHIRDHGVRISGTTYMPLESPIALEDNLNLICEKALKINNPFEMSLFLLVQLSYLQAFMDVNKRTSRLSANIPLIKYNLVPLSFNDVQHTDYITAMIAVYEKNDTRLIADLFINSYRKTALSYSAIADAVGFDEVRIKYRQERRSLLGQIILNLVSPPQVESYISDKIIHIPKEHQHDFIQDLKEDLSNIGPHQLGGLGVSRQDLDKWKTNSREE